jgi:hypothetical protein
VLDDVATGPADDKLVVLRGPRTQIYEGTNQIQRIVMARQFLS